MWGHGSRSIKLHMKQTPSQGIKTATTGSWKDRCGVCTFEYPGNMKLLHLANLALAILIQLFVSSPVAAQYPNPLSGEYMIVSEKKSNSPNVSFHRIGRNSSSRSSNLVQCQLSGQFIPGDGTKIPCSVMFRPCRSTLYSGVLTYAWSIPPPH